jgi:hypothetical protein
METKFCAPDAGLHLGQGWQVAGYASLFGLRDKGGDVVARGAYAACLARMAAKGEQVRMLWQHDPAQPIGVWDEVFEDARGLFVKGRLLPEVARAREAAALLQAKAMDGLSIGYRTLRAAKLPEGGRSLIELDLWEVSLVTFPMLAEARLAQKAADAALLRDISALRATLRGAVAQITGQRTQP